MPIDRGPRSGLEAQPELAQPRVQCVAVRGGEGGSVLDARRERLAPAIQRYASLALRTTRRGTAPGVDSSRTSGDDRPVFRDPSGSWPGLPVPLVDLVTLASPQCGIGPYGSGLLTVNRVIHEIRIVSGIGG